MIDFKVRGIERIEAKIKKLPKKFQAIAYEEAAIHLIGDQNRGLQYYPPQVATPYVRTYKFRFGWEVKKFEAGNKSRIINRVPYAKYPNTRWARAPWNWKTIDQRIRKELPTMMTAIKKQIALEITHEGLSRSY